MKNEFRRQGDVGIERVRSVPKGATRAEGGVLALGESTGHAHQVSEGQYQRYTMPDGSQIVEVRSTYAIVSHEDHAPAVLPKGVYRVGIQTEYLPEGRVNVFD